jgi:hypothetical protein
MEWSGGVVVGGTPFDIRSFVDVADGVKVPSSSPCLMNWGSVAACSMHHNPARPSQVFILLLYVLGTDLRSTPHVCIKTLCSHGNEVIMICIFKVKGSWDPNRIFSRGLKPKSRIWTIIRLIL